MAEKNVTGLTSMLGRFQVLLWDEYAAKKQRSKTTPVLYHLQSSVDSAAPPQLARNGFLRPSISDAFAHEEGTTDPLYADWCEELYSQASNSLDEPGAANLAAQDAGTIQCALLRFLGKRQQVCPPKPKLTLSVGFRLLRQPAYTSCREPARNFSRYYFRHRA